MKFKPYVRAGAKAAQGRRDRHRTTESEQQRLALGWFFSAIPTFIKAVHEFRVNNPITDKSLA
jgi:hypothetical protein